jgi:hypothetical protein
MTPEQARGVLMRMLLNEQYLTSVQREAVQLAVNHLIAKDLPELKH